MARAAYATTPRPHRAAVATRRSSCRPPRPTRIAADPHCVGPLVSCSRSPVLVVEAHDVVLAEIIAALHLDQHERISAGILEAMHRLDRNVRRLIRFQLEHVIAARDAGAAVDDDPMLAAPMMQL